MDQPDVGTRRTIQIRLNGCDQLDDVEQPQCRKLVWEALGDWYVPSWLE
ncbi:hypothetical protein DAI22_11g188650 [Oryza sativa Japonica Group]|nr:hypothetical protein DAI22_11g188650 [Oryza sativa Japonica Group]